MKNMKNTNKQKLFLAGIICFAAVAIIFIQASRPQEQRFVNYAIGTYLSTGGTAEELYKGGLNFYLLENIDSVDSVVSEFLKNGGTAEELFRGGLHFFVQ
ncbi:MAG: hypothetical protein FWG64_08715 [Firmicutes bacterium]|nr:hypothetical protein [Bacillota bacterium]